MDSQIQEIKNKLDVLDIVGGYVKLTKTGVNHRGQCPFHKEKTPSFFVSQPRQMWHCFGCGKGGDIFEFIKAIEGVEFGDALRILAQKAGVQLKKENIKLKTERHRLYEICELSCAFFEKQLHQSQSGKEAMTYLLNRGLLDKSIKKWRIGYSPDTWNGLSDFLVGRGYTREEIIKAGLSVVKENKNDSYDRFRGRIMFPIFDTNSQVVGFGARFFSTKGGSASGGKDTIEMQTAKYINTPQTILYDKSNLLYGLNFAKLFTRKENQIVLTEGYTDTIMSHQAGFENTVATSGTALTQQHLNILKRYTDNLILAFDMDTAGQNATTRGIDLAQEKGFNIKVIDTYEAKDPADIILEDPLKWQDVLQKAKPIVNYYFDSAFLKFDKSNPEGKREISKIVLPIIKKIENKIEQSFWIQKLSQKLDIKEDAIIFELNKIVSKNSSQQQNNNYYNNSEKSTQNNRKGLIEEKIIFLILNNPSDINLISKEYFQFFSDKTRQFLENMKNFTDKYFLQFQDDLQSESNKDQKQLKTKEQKFKDFFDNLITNNKEEFNSIFGDNANNFLAIMALKAEVNYQETGQEEIPICLYELRRLVLREQRDIISKNISFAEQEKDEEKLKQLMEQLNKIPKDI